MIKYAIAASGNGTVFGSIIDAQTKGQIPHGQIAALISNKADAGAINRAYTANIPSHYIDYNAPQKEIDKAFIKALKDSGAQFLFLAGFLKRISPAVLAEVPVYNTHPALDLRRFGGAGMYGKYVHKAVIEAKAKFSGVTIHEVNEDYDRGRILMQSPKVTVTRKDTEDTLQQKIQEEEYKLVPEFIAGLTKKMAAQEIKVVIVGGGGREHALANQIHRDNASAQIIAIPGNAGITTQIPGAKCIPLAATDVDAITEFCIKEKPDMTIVASDDPLALGLVDKLTAAGLRAFGPTRTAAEIEWSKSFSKDFMKRHKIPTAEYQIFNNYNKAIAYIKKAQHPLVIKANGLALGKGVVISNSAAESESAIRIMMEDKKFGSSGETIIIEEFLTGPEITLLAFVDGKNYSLMPTSQDHKRAFDNDQGPNTGGMGAFSPAAAWSAARQDEVIKNIVEPTIKGMAKEGRAFKGILYFGLMATKTGVKVIEYNARFGDPECQTILPLLNTPLIDIFNACIDGKLDEIEIEWENQCALCVVIASAEYPGDVKKGLPTTIDDLDPEVNLIHSGTKTTADGLVTDGGRVFCLTTTADTMQEARRKVYAEIGKVRFEGARYRKDIGGRESVN